MVISKNILDKIALVNHELNDCDTFHSFISCLYWLQAIRTWICINQIMSIRMRTEIIIYWVTNNNRFILRATTISNGKYNIKHDIVRSDLIFMLVMSQNCFYACTMHGHQKFSLSHITSITKRFVIQKNCCNVTNFACH